MLERELKFEAGVDIVLPDLTALVDGARVTALPTLDLVAVYHDTADLRLARWGATLRYRPEPGREPWTAKLAAGRTPLLHARHEVGFPGEADTVPPDAVALLRGLTRGAPLAPVARLVTRRVRFEVAGNGASMAEVDDDEVTVYDGERVAARFREIEVELTEAAGDDVAARAARALRKAGATPAPTDSKLLRAVSPDGPLAPEITVPRLGSRATVGELVTAAVAAGAHRLIAHDPAVRLDVDIEAVHQARVATRRLRSDLQTFAASLEPTWRDAVRRELSWLGHTLGTVRDADVLGARLEEAVASLPTQDHRPGRRLLEALAATRAEARAVLLEAMASDRYTALLDALVTAADDPPLLADGRDAKGAVAVRGLVEHRWDKVRRAARDAEDDAGLHAVRIAVKRARYAAEAGRPVLGKKGAAVAGALADVQTVLGDLQDAVVAETWLRGAVPARGASATALAAGELVARERAAAAAARAAWPRAWRQAKRVWRGFAS